METVEERFRRLTANLDFRQPSRAEWRAIGYGTDRRALQTLLLQLAEGARIGTQADYLALLKAAHAVLPLRGTERSELARLLLNYPPIALEWCDILIETLADDARPELLSAAALLEGLQLSVESAGNEAAEQRRLRTLLHQIFLLGYHPNWLLQRLSEKRIAEG